MGRLSWFAGALVVCSTLLVAGCGDDDGSDDPGATTAATGDATSAASSSAQGTTAQATQQPGQPTNTPGPPTSTPKADICAYLPKSAAEALVPGTAFSNGRTTGVQVGQDGGDLGTCLYQASDGTRAAVTIILRWSDPETATSGFLNAKRQAKPAPVDISGVGQQAFWWPDEGQVNILNGRTWVIIRVLDPARPAAAEPPAAIGDIGRSVVEATK